MAHSYLEDSRLVTDKKLYNVGKLDAPTSQQCS